MTDNKPTTPRVKNGIVQRGKTWSYVIRITDSRGISKPRWVGGFPTEAEAKAARDQARVSAHRGEYVERNGMTVGQYLTEWLTSHALEVKPRTHASYAQLVHDYVLPHIGHLRLQALRPSTLSAMYRTLLERGGRRGGALSPRTVAYVHAVLRKALNDAVRTDQLIQSNPAERAKRPRRVEGSGCDDYMWGAAELTRFLGIMEGHRLYAFYRLAAFSGARRGELLHLRWSDLHLEDPGMMKIRGSVGMANGRRVEGTTKSGAERVVSIDAGTVQALRHHRQVQEDDQAWAGDSWEPGDWVFRRQLGAPLHPDTPSALMAKSLRAHNATCARVEGYAVPLEPIRLHDLRHVHATLLLRAGVPVHVVSRRLGHADPSVTLRVYAHVLGDQATEVAAVFAGAMGETDKTTGAAQ